MDRTYVTVNIRIYYHTLTFGLYTHRQIPTVIILKTIGGKSKGKFMSFFFFGGGERSSMVRTAGESLRNSWFG